MELSALLAHAADFAEALHSTSTFLQRAELAA
jgi:hypothetical protein